MALKGYYQGMADLERAEKETAKVKEALGSIAMLTTFLKGQEERADTAWKEYERGYRALSGKAIDTDKSIGEKGFFKRRYAIPKDAVIIGDKSYSSEDVMELGNILFDPVSFTHEEDIVSRFKE